MFRFFLTVNKLKIIWQQSKEINVIYSIMWPIFWKKAIILYAFCFLSNVCLDFFYCKQAKKKLAIG